MMADNHDWAIGNPSDLADAFQRTVGKKGSLTRRQYKYMVTAIACAQAERVLQQVQQPSGSKLRNWLENILVTASTILAIKAKDAESEDEESIYSSDEYESDWEEVGSDDPLNAEQAGPLSAPGLPLLERVINEILDVSTKTAAAASATKPAAASAPSSSTPGPSPAAEAADDGLPLPLLIIQAIFSHLDSRSAAKAAAACKQLNNLHKQLRYFDPSPAAIGYAQAVQAIQECDDMFSDGSCEASFACKWPLDGSGVCGSDLDDDAAGRAMVAMLPMLAKFGALFGGPGAQAAVMAELKQKRGCATR